MSIDYIVASLPALVFGAAAPISWDKFVAAAGDGLIRDSLERGGWQDIETQLRNAVAEARNGDAHKRTAVGCSVFWKNRIVACFQEKDVLKRDELLDRVWWDAAEEMTSPTAPLGIGAIATYAIRLKIALKRDKISVEAGNVAFDRLTAETKR